MTLAMGTKERKCALDGLSYTSWSNCKIFSDSTASLGLDLIILPVLPIKRKWWWKIWCSTLLDVVTAITLPATVTVNIYALLHLVADPFRVMEEMWCIKIFIWHFFKSQILLHPKLWEYCFIKHFHIKKRRPKPTVNLIFTSQLFTLTALKTD